MEKRQKVRGSGQRRGGRGTTSLPWLFNVCACIYIYIYVYFFFFFWRGRSKCCGSACPTGHPDALGSTVLIRSHFAHCSSGIHADSEG